MRHLSGRPTKNPLIATPEQALARKLYARLTAPADHASLWQPHPDNIPQQMAYDLAMQVDELGYGGQAGGGKTDLALGLACTQFKTSIIFRREYPRLKGVIKRGNEIYPASYVSGEKHYWQFGGHVVELGHIQHEKHWENYAGTPRDLMVFDEAAEFTETQVRNVTGWARDADGRHVLTLLGFNPPRSAEGEWIIRYFAPWLDPDYPNPAAPGEIRYFAYLDDEMTEVESAAPFEHGGLSVLPISRTFIPASRFDNPFLGEDYERRLQALPEPLRSQLLFGDFTIGLEDDPWQTIPKSWVLEAQERWRQTERPQLKLRGVGVDVAHGGKDQTVISKLYGNYIDEIIAHPGETTPKGKDTAKNTIDAMESNAPIYIDSIGYGASAHEVLEDMQGVEVYGVNFGAGADGTDKSGMFGFANVRAEAYWKLREALDPESGEGLALPPSRELRVDLTAPRYTIRAGRYVIEEKKEIIKRTGYSPDMGDSVVILWWGANRPRQNIHYLDAPDVLSDWRG